MAMVKKSFTVTDQQDEWIKCQIESGLFGNESEVVRELIRERQIRERENVQVEAIRAKLLKAETSGFTKQSADELLSEIKEGLSISGKV